METPAPNQMRPLANIEVLFSLTDITAFKHIGVIHRTAALPQVQHRGESARDIVLRLFNRRLQWQSLGQTGSNGAGKGAARSVCIWIVDSLAVEPFASLSVKEQIVGVADLVAALAENTAAIPYRKSPPLLSPCQLQSQCSCLREPQPLGYWVL